MDGRSKYKTWANSTLLWRHQGLWEAAGAKEETSSQTASRSRTLVWQIMESNVVNLVTQELTLAGDEIQISKRPAELQAIEQGAFKEKMDAHEQDLLSSSRDI